MPIWLIAALVGAGLGVGGTIGIQALGRDDSAAVEATAEVVDATAGVVEQVQAPEVVAAETHQALATMPAATIAVQAAVEEGAEPAVRALAAYLACLQYVQGPESSAGLGCRERGEAVDRLLGVE